MDSKIALDANSQPEKNLITKQVREGKIKYYFLKKFGKRLTIQRYLAHQNIPNIIVFLNFWPTIVWQWKGKIHRVPDWATHDQWATVGLQSWVGFPIIVPLRIHSIQYTTKYLSLSLVCCLLLDESAQELISTLRQATTLWLLGQHVVQYVVLRSQVQRHLRS